MLHLTPPYILLLNVIATTVQANVPTTNLTAAHEDVIVCVYQLSGQYGLLPRIVYYCTIVFAIIGRYQEWLVIGALASALSYSSCAAIHIIGLVKSRHPIYDLDILGCWAILSTGSLAFVAMVHWSSTVKQSRARVVLIVWGALMGVGLITGRALLFDVGLRLEPACRSNSGQLLEYPYQRLDPAYNCTYKCFGAQELFRQQNEQLAIPAWKLNTGYAGYGVLLVGPILAAAYKSLTLDFNPHSPSEMCRRFVIGILRKSKNVHQRLTDHIFDVGASSWYSGYFVLFGYMRRLPWSWLHCWYWTFVYPWLVVELLLDILTPPMFVANIVLNELNIQAQQLPNNEQPYAVGQWSPVLATFLVMLASGLTKALAWWETRKKREILREDGPPHPVHEMQNTPNVRDMEEGQVSGVVIPTLKHAETLRE